MPTEQLHVVKRAAADRGRTELGWLHSRHTFSFGDYHDPAHMGYRSLRVINDDIVEPGQGFGTHGHRDMEILSYVIEGELHHEDSLGNGRTIRAGELQYMSAGTGVLHSEFNPSDGDRVHFLQIWIRPAQRGGAPLYADRNVKAVMAGSGLTLLACGDGRDGAVQLRQDADVFLGRLAAGEAIDISPDERHPFAYVQVIRGAVRLGDQTLEPGDGTTVEGSGFALRATQDAEFLLFRMA